MLFRSQEESAVRMQHNAYLEHNRMKSANLKADLDALRANGMNIGLMYEGNGALGAAGAYKIVVEYIETELTDGTYTD